MAGTSADPQPRARRALVVLLSMSFLAPLIVGNPSATASGPPPPSYAHDFPDPVAIQVGNTFYAFATNVFPFGVTINVPVVQSSDRTNWTYVTDALPNLGSWAAEGRTWAPDVSGVGDHWVLYYTAQDAGSGRQCIGRAIAASPTGPFTDDFGAPLVCQLDRAGSIDPSSFVTTAGDRWLVWKSEDDVLGGQSIIWSAPLSADGTTLTASATALLVADAAWEARTIEGPSMVRSADTLFLFYGGNDYQTSAQAIGYATCTSPAGPCTKRSTSQPWMSTAATGIQGPGGPSILRTSDDSDVLVFHGWINGVGYPGGERAMYLQPLDFSSGAPRVPILPVPGNRFLRNTNTTGVADNTLVFGDPGDTQLACDVTGSGIDTPVIFRGGIWYLRNTNTTGVADKSFAYGDAGDVPVCGDWNGAGVDTPGVFRQGKWYLRYTNTTGVADRVFGYGDPGDQPIVGRWTGSATSVGVHRGIQFLLSTQLGSPFADLTLTYGVPSDRAVAGDWNGDGVDTVGVFRFGAWYLRDTNTSGFANVVFSYGDPADTPLAGDWNGDGIDTIGVAR